MTKSSFFLSKILERFLRISYDLGNGTFCMLFLGEPDIDIPEE